MVNGYSEVKWCISVNGPIRKMHILPILCHDCIQDNYPIMIHCSGLYYPTLVYVFVPITSTVL